jgi:hypothetical protein
MLVIDFYYQLLCLEFVPEWEGTSTGYPFNDIFHIDIKPVLFRWPVFGR